jgi:hypothetical protein
MEISLLERLLLDCEFLSQNIPFFCAKFKERTSSGDSFCAGNCKNWSIPLILNEVRKLVSREVAKAQNILKNLHGFAAPRDVIFQIF